MTHIDPLSTKVKSLRQKNDISQEDMANILGMSRVTYSQIEQGERELKHSELVKLAKVFEITIEELLHLEDSKTTSKTPTSQKKDTHYKFKQVVLYILNQCAQKPNIGKTVVNKLLYFSDFNFYEKYRESITNATYIKLPKGPAPEEMDNILKDMEKEQSIKQMDIPYFGYQQNRIIPLRKPDLEILNAKEVDEIDEVLAQYSDKSADRLSERSHGDMPRKATKKNGEQISYGLVHYRTLVYSVSEAKDDD